MQFRLQRMRTTTARSALHAFHATGANSLCTSLCSPAGVQDPARAGGGPGQPDCQPPLLAGKQRGPGCSRVGTGSARRACLFSRCTAGCGWRRCDQNVLVPCDAGPAAVGDGGRSRRPAGGGSGEPALPAWTFCCPLHARPCCHACLPGFPFANRPRAALPAAPNRPRPTSGCATSRTSTRTSWCGGATRWAELALHILEATRVAVHRGAAWRRLQGRNQPAPLMATDPVTAAAAGSRSPASVFSSPSQHRSHLPPPHASYLCSWSGWPRSPRSRLRRWHTSSPCQLAAAAMRPSRRCCTTAPHRCSRWCSNRLGGRGALTCLTAAVGTAVTHKAPACWASWASWDAPAAVSAAAAAPQGLAPGQVTAARAQAPHHWEMPKRRLQTSSSAKHPASARRRQAPPTVAAAAPRLARAAATASPRKTQSDQAALAAACAALHTRSTCRSGCRWPRCR